MIRRPPRSTLLPDTPLFRSADTAIAGYQLMVAGDILRGRFRRGLERPAPVRAGAVEPYVLTLRAVAMNSSEEHTSELPSRQYLVCRLLLEKNISSSDTFYSY